MFFLEKWKWMVFGKVQYFLDEGTLTFENLKRQIMEGRVVY